MFLQFIKFCVVGGTGVVVDFGITFLFKEKLKLNKYIANSLGFMAAASTNYLLNRWWTFRSHHHLPAERQSAPEFLPVETDRHRTRHAVELLYELLFHIHRKIIAA